MPCSVDGEQKCFDTKGLVVKRFTASQICGLIKGYMYVWQPALDEELLEYDIGDLAKRMSAST